MSIVAISNTSTYIQGGLDVTTSVSGTNIIVTEKLYFRRTNVYSGSTYSSSVTGTLNISTQATSSTTAITVAGGQQNVWQGPFYTATWTFDSSRSGNTITCSWSTTDNVASWFSGSGSASITLPTVTVAPSGLSVTLKDYGENWGTFAVSLSSYGIPSSTDGRYIEAGITQENSYTGSTSNGRRWSIAKNTTSSTITVNNSSSTNGGPNGAGYTITGNTKYYYGGYATNTSLTTNTMAGNFVTLPPAPTITVSNITTTTATIKWATTADGGFYSKNIVASGAGLSSKTIATVSTGTASSGTYSLTGLTPSTKYTITYYAKTTSGSSTTKTVSFTTANTSSMLYGSVSGKTTKIHSFYGSVNGKTTGITKLYGSVGGQTKLIHRHQWGYSAPTD